MEKLTGRKGKSKRLSVPGPPHKEKKGKKGLKEKFMDVRNTAPNKYTRRIFEAIYPFLQITESGDSSVKQNFPNKFEGLKVDYDVLHKAMTKCVKHVLTAHESHKSCKSETQGRALHEALFTGFTQLVRPCRKDLEELTRKQRCYEQDTLAKTKRGRIEYNISTKDDEETNAGFNIEELPHTKEGAGSSSNGEFLIEDEDLMDGEQGQGFSDSKVYVHNYAATSKSSSGVIDPKKLVLVVEKKWFNTESAYNGIYQGAAYACQGAKSNFDKGHTNPIYVLVLCYKEWTYAKIEITGWVEVENGKIKENTIENPKIMSLESLTRQLELGTKFCRNHFMERDERFNYPDDSYIVGNIFLCKKWYELPTITNFFQGIGSLLFYEGLLRIIFGDCILRWKIEDLERLIDLNKKMIKETIFLLLGDGPQTA